MQFQNMFLRLLSKKPKKNKQGEEIKLENKLEFAKDENSNEINKEEVK